MSEYVNLTPRQRSCIPNVHFDLIPIRDLVSNQDYQRMLSESHITKAIREFDICQVNPVKVSRRNGYNYVFDGQHTIEIIASVSGSRETPVWCMVYDDLKYQEEAHIFAEQQKHVKPLLPYEMFTAHVEAGDPKQTMINSLVNGFGLKVSKTYSPGCICAVAALESIYNQYGYEVLDRTLRLTLATWEGDRLSLSSCMLKGIARIISVFGDSLDDEVFKEHVGNNSPKAIVRTARDRRPGTLGYAEALVLAYNHKNKKHLNMAKLFWNGKKKDAPEDIEDYPERE